MPDEDKNFGGSLVLDFRKWWRHVKTIYTTALDQCMTKLKMSWSSARAHVSLIDGDGPENTASFSFNHKQTTLCVRG